MSDKRDVRIAELEAELKRVKQGGDLRRATARAELAERERDTAVRALAELMLPVEAGALVPRPPPRGRSPLTPRAATGSLLCDAP